MQNFDEILERYNAISKEIKTLEDEKDELRVQILANYEQCESERFTVSVKEVVSERLESLNVIKDKSVKLFDALYTSGCVREIKSHRIKILTKD